MVFRMLLVIITYALPCRDIMQDIDGGLLSAVLRLYFI